MPSSLLFGVNSEGRVHSLSTAGTAWREMQYVGLDFKRLSAVPHFLWAVGGDRQIYVHVHGLDVPIRVKEEAYENERWIPLEGFSSRLFPTDRYHFSSADGTVDRSIDKIHVPSMAWQWESDWHLDTTLNGQPLDHDGWTYAVDFPAQYHAQKQWKSCVRRRKWVRCRRYSAMNSWCSVAPLHKDPTQEPFIDVAIGGNYLPGAQPGTLLVWAVTAHGRIEDEFKVMFRTGVSTSSPEGLRWTNVQTPPGCEVNQISVGPTGLVWAVLWNGRALVRSGITRDNPTGESWLEVRPPGDGLKLAQVSVGYNAIWGVTTDGGVWFRKGVSGDNAGKSENAAIGSGWVEQVGNMAMVSVAPNDQVWGIGNEDRCLYFRAGVTSSDLTGKTWRLVQAPLQLSRASSSASLGFAGPIPKYHQSLRSSDKKHRSWTSLNRPQSTYNEPSNMSTEWEETSRSAPTPTSLRLKQDENVQPSPPGPESYSEGSENELPPASHSDSPSAASSHGEKNHITQEVKAEPFIITGKHFEQPIKSSKAWSPVRSVGSVVGTEANPESDVWDSENSRDSGIFPEEDDSLAFYWTECDAMWTWVTAGACTVDIQALPNWFVDIPTLNQSELSEPWRIELLEALRNRLPNNLEFANYEAAIDMSSWIKRGEARCLPRGNFSQSVFEECIVELEWVSSSTGTMHSGTLTILNPDGATTKMQFSLSEITCIMCCSEPGNPRLAIFTPRLPNGKYPIKLQFSSDTELEDWLANLTSVCCQMNEVHGRPCEESIWATTSLGDVFVFDPASLKINQKNGDHYTVELDVSIETNPYKAVLQNSFGPGSILTISGCIDERADRISFNLECHPLIKIRHKAESEVRDVPFHFNPRFDTNTIVRNTMRDGKWDNDEERDGEMVLQPGLEFMMKIVCENDGYRVFIHGKEYCFFKHRLSPEAIYQLVILGKLRLFKVTYRSKNVVIAPQDMFWRQMGGHLRQVETCPAGIIWGISYDNTALVYTGGWGGAFLKGLETSSSGINPMTDTQTYYVYENQRWNPVTGYTSTGLPTDRHMWSDVTGKHKRTRDHAKLLSMHWQWISDWLVDFHTPGGVDRDGWQYAVDFPSKYHAKKSLTDMVRRRRWFRRAKLVTNGPWHEVGNSKIIDISLQNPTDNGEIVVWAVATNGDALFRKGVTKSCPAGTVWGHVACDQPLCSISAGPQNQVWAVGRNGSAYWRFGITQEKREGEVWNNVEPPAGAQLKQISVSYNVVWGLDTLGRLSVRRDITPMFPEGTYWQILPNVPLDQSDDTPTSFRQVSVGSNADQVWAIASNGLICKRCGISPENPAGNGWIYGINGMWHHVSVKSWNFDK